MGKSTSIALQSFRHICFEEQQKRTDEYKPSTSNRFREKLACTYQFGSIRSRSSAWAGRSVRRLALPTIPWLSHRYSPITPRKFVLIPHVNQRLGFMVRSEGGADANNFNDGLETPKNRVRVQCAQRIRIGDSILTLSVSEIETPSPSIQRPGDGADILACHWSSSVRTACAT